MTEGKPQVTDIQPLSGWQQDAMLREVKRTKPFYASIGAIVSCHVKEPNIEILVNLKNKKALIGSGVEGDVDGVKYQVLAPSKSYV
ncbi:hypothetical protein O9992_15530 [Vibrio lentus]|nr:hypothetical protein [Vibrio lentus]